MSEEQKAPEAGNKPRYPIKQGVLRWYKGNKITLDLRPEASRMLNDLMNLTESDAEDIFRKALALYKAAVDAHWEGKAVGVAASPDVLETEFVGF